MQPNDLTSLYLAELQEACSSEAQIYEALPGFAGKAGSNALNTFLSDEMLAARERGTQLRALLDRHKITGELHKDGAMQAMLKEGLDWSADIADPTVRDVALIASIQRMMHYNIAVYGSLADWARLLDLADGETLDEALEATRRADARLTEIAQGRVNSRAA